MLSYFPRIDDLFYLIKKVPSYPVSARDMVDLAKKESAPHEVVKFYEAFPRNLKFRDEDDLAGRSEQVEIMNETLVKGDQPREIQSAPEED